MGPLIRYALFDFDGTISLIREGWQEIMIPYFTEVLIDTPMGRDRSRKSVQRQARDFIDFLTGKATIYQCMRLKEEVEKLGGVAEDPAEYKAEYLRRLRRHIAGRLALLESGADPERFIVTGARRYLEGLRKRGVKLYLASGTDHEDVMTEARLLRVAHLFDGGIYGAREDVEGSSKATVIRGIIKDIGNGKNLLGVGDGYVEIENTVAVGGFPIGVASNERAIGTIDEWKSNRLLQAGAYFVIPDFSRYKELMSLVTYPI